MKQTYYPDPIKKSMELAALVGRRIEVESVRYGQIRVYRGLLTDIEPFYFVEMNLRPDGLAGVIHSMAEKRCQGGRAFQTLKFLGIHSAIRRIATVGTTVYKCPYIPDDYNETDVNKVLTIRSRMFGLDATLVIP